jgi:secreted trypsin-like serine protease
MVCFPKFEFVILLVTLLGSFMPFCQGSFHKLRNLALNDNNNLSSDVVPVEPTDVAVSSAIAASLALQQKQGPTARIVGGTNASAGEYTFFSLMLAQGSDQKWHSFGCGASLISNCYVATAAHCIQDTTSASLGIYISAYKPYDGNLGEPFVFAQVRSMSSPSNYKDATNQNDIALLRLDSCVDTAAFPPVRLADASFSVGGMLTALGFGRLAENSSTEVRTLQKVNVPYVDPTACRNMYAGSSFTLYSGMICAGFAAGGKDSCHGDSGGPLIDFDSQGKPVQVGVVSLVIYIWTVGTRSLTNVFCSIHKKTSWGDGCAKANRPGVYTEIASQLEWISQTVCSDSATPRSFYLCQSAAGALCENSRGVFKVPDTNRSGLRPNDVAYIHYRCLDMLPGHEGNQYCYNYDTDLKMTGFEYCPLSCNPQCASLI